MGQPRLSPARPVVGVVDIGTNSMRLLITDGKVDYGRWTTVTGLGRGVDQTGVLSDDAISKTIAVLEGYADQMTEAGVDIRFAMATSASRDATNRDEFFDDAATALGFRPELISGEQEGLWAFAGAVSDFDLSEVVVTDIGGGSTELVTADRSISIDIGSVRLSDHFPERPFERLEEAREHVRDLLGSVTHTFGEHIGVAGTWTSLAAIGVGQITYDPAAVHGYRLGKSSLDTLASRLAGMTISETEAILSLDPARAPVIAAGALIAAVLVERLGFDSTLISVKDTLDGAAMQQLRLYAE